MKYNFSEIQYCNTNNTYDKRLLGKYISQVFDLSGEYITIIIADTLREVYDLQQKLF